MRVIEVGKKAFSFAIFTIATLFIGGAIWMAYVEISYMPAKSVSDELQSGYSPTNWSPERESVIVSKIEYLPASCFWLYNESKRIVSLALLDRKLPPIVSFHAYSTILSKNADSLQRAIGCNPLRQNVWLSYIQLSSILSFDGEEMEKQFDFLNSIDPFQPNSENARTDLYDLISK